MSNSDQIYTTITNQIIEAMENAPSWESPFKQLAEAGFPVNASNGKDYQGINILNLWSAQQLNGFTSNEWGTFKQWKAKGFSVEKGQKAIVKVIFYKSLKIKDRDTGEDKNIPMIKWFAVFNRDQTDAPKIAPKMIEPTTGEIDAGFQAWVDSTGADVQSNEQNKAYYSMAADIVSMPKLENIKTVDSYQSTLAHELVHWTGHSSRLDRFKGPDREAYAFEELIAELGAAFVCAKLGISQGEHSNHASYIKSWLKALKNDNRFIFRASAQAQKAVDYLNVQ